MRVTNLAMIVVSVLSAAACTGRSPQPVQVQPVPRAATEDGTQNMTTNGSGQQVSEQTLPEGSGIDARVQISKDDLQARYATLDFNNLTYRFQYLTKNQTDKMIFDAQNKATLRFTGLPVNQSGTVTLEILEAGTVKLRGTKANVTLQAGRDNTLDIELQALDGGTQTTDLTLEVSIGQPGGTPPANPPPSNPPPANPPPANPPPANPPPANPPPANPPPANPPPSNPDPISNWDGKSFQGNSKWKIVPVDG